MSKVAGDKEKEMDGENESREIEQIIEKASAYLRSKNFKQAAAIVKYGLETYPKQEQLLALFFEIKNKYKKVIIEKLEEEAISLLRAGAEDEAQIRFRKILELDPTRTELEASLRDTRAETAAAYHERLRRSELFSAAKWFFLVVFLVLSIFSLWARWDNGRHLKRAENFIAAGQLEHAKQELEKCGWILATNKDKIKKDFQSAVDSLMLQAHQCMQSKNFGEAITYFEKVASISENTAEIEQKIEECRQLEKQMEKELARIKSEDERQKILSEKALNAKQEFEQSLSISLDGKCDVDAKSVLDNAKAAAREAEEYFSQDNFESAQEKWTFAAGECQRAIEISKEVKETLAIKLKCDQVVETAKKINANNTSADIWQQAEENYNTAKKYFSDNNMKSAKENWNLAASKFEEAIQASPDYRRAMLMLEKWSNLQVGLNENDVLQLFGDPKCVQSASEGSIWYYQCVPNANQTDPDISKFDEVECGYIRFTTLSPDIEDGIREIYQNYIDAEQKLHKKFQKGLGPVEKRIILFADGKVENANNSDHIVATTAEDTRHRKRLEELLSDFQQKINNSVNGLQPMEINYVVSDWVLPSEEDLINLLSVDELGDENSIRRTGKWQFQTNWKNLKLNITEDDVRSILGSPDSTSSENGVTIYRYGNLPEYGELIFETRVDSSSRLSYWMEPLWSQVRQEMQKKVISSEMH